MNKCETYRYSQIFSCNAVVSQLPQHNILFSDEFAQSHPIQELPQLNLRCNNLIEEHSKIEGMIEEMKLNLRLMWRSLKDSLTKLVMTQVKSFIA